MKKLRLNIEALTVETFCARENGGKRLGTVQAHAQAQPDTEWPNETCRILDSCDSHCAWGTTCYPNGELGTC